MKYVLGQGSKCVGHILTRGRAFEAFDADDKTLGLFQSEADAVKMIFSREDLHDQRPSGSHRHADQ